MSCGKPHETPCSEVLEQVYSYLDGEIDDPGYAKIRQHLDECGPCLREYGLEEIIKQLVHKYCGYDAVPVQLRAKVMARIQEIRVTMEADEISAE
ncbi:MAG: mycothiol system anti-sigma-R factor [Actinobacteria bacterium]|jgi:mycothiol system anti-sigma-R factor|nr:mycothiol system anti-sigma-R factor [Actinomycetota bacterium]MBO0785351.1 mycothiol system anti-sigma-R factor [Actinomycetota bacterium]MDR0345048.1 mycothiol system anti-sigma-R factor [Nocardiopsaceae bacterium]